MNARRRGIRGTTLPEFSWLIRTVVFILIALSGGQFIPAATSAAPNAELTVCEPGYKMYPPTEKCLPEDDPVFAPALVKVTGWACPRSDVDWDLMADTCTESFNDLVLAPNGSTNWKLPNFAPNQTAFEDLGPGIFSIRSRWSGTRIIDHIAAQCTEMQTGLDYKLAIEYDGELQTSLNAGSFLDCNYYMIPPDSGLPLSPIDDLDEPVQLPESLFAELQVLVRHCDNPVDDVRIAFDQCAVNTRDTLSNATSEFKVVDTLGTEESQSQLGAVTYAFSGLLAGSVTITPSYPQRSDVSGTLFDCVDGASGDQGATIGFVALGETFTLQANRGSRFMCSAYVVPVPGAFAVISSQKIQFTFWHCDNPVEVFTIARESCPNADRNNADDTSVTITGAPTVGPLGAELTVSAGEIASFTNVPVGMNFRWILPDRSDVDSILISCKNLANTAQPVQEHVTIPDRVIEPTWAQNANLMCDVYVSPTEGENGGPDEDQSEDTSDPDSPDNGEGPAEDQGVGSLTVTLTACPHEFSAQGVGSLAEGLAGCDLAAPQTSATLINPDEDVVASFLLGVDDPTSVTEADIPPGTYEIRVFPPTLGGFEGTVFCETDGEVAKNDPFAILADVETTCSIFIILPEEEDGQFLQGGVGTIEITVAACPGGVNAPDFENSAEAIATCDHPTQLTNVYLLDDEQDVFNSGPIGGDQPGTRTFNEVPIGNYSLEGTIPADYAGSMVICDVDGTTWTDGSLEVLEGDTTTCSVILTLANNQDEPEPDPADDDPDDGQESVPVDEGDDPVEGGEEPVGSILVFIKGCAEDVTLPESPVLQNAIDVCTEDAPWTTVDIYNSDGELMYGGYSGDYGLNSVPNEIVFVGTYTLDVVPPDGYALALPYCWQEEIDDNTANGSNGPEAATNPDVLNTASNDVIEVVENMKTTCYVYLVPAEGEEDVSVEPGEPNAEEPADGESGAIEVNLYGCEAGFVPSELDTSRLLYNSCPDTVPEMAVDIYDSTGTIAYSGYGSSPVTFQDVTAGTYSIVLTLPAGYDGFYAYCSQGTEYLSSTFTLEAGVTATCSVYLTKAPVIG